MMVARNGESFFWTVFGTGWHRSYYILWKQQQGEEGHHFPFHLSILHDVTINQGWLEDCVGASWLKRNLTCDLTLRNHIITRIILIQLYIILRLFIRFRLNHS